LPYLQVEEEYMEMSAPIVPETDKIEDSNFYVIFESGGKSRGLRDQSFGKNRPIVE